MQREVLNYVLKQNEYLEGGTKEACVKVRDFLLHARNSGNQIYSLLTCISSDEFMKSVKVLMAYAFQQEDEIPETWHCDEKCARSCEVFCPGECNISEDSKNKCPYYAGEKSL